MKYNKTKFRFGGMVRMPNQNTDFENQLVGQQKNVITDI